MPDDPLPDCPSRAAWWRNRAASVTNAELRQAYAQVARSYEQLAGQWQLCHMLVEREARQSGRSMPCCCPEYAAAGD